MKKFILQIAKAYATDIGAAQGFRKFMDMKEHPGWGELMRMSSLIQGLMAQEMFSSSYTKLTIEEKDIPQTRRRYITIFYLRRSIMAFLKGFFLNA